MALVCVLFVCCPVTLALVEIFVCVRVHARVCGRLYVRARVCVRVFVCARTCVRVYARVCWCVRVCVLSRTRVLGYPF